MRLFSSNRIIVLLSVLAAIMGLAMESEADVLSPMFPRAQILERYGVERDDRAIWNDSTSFHIFEDVGHSAVIAYADSVFVEYVCGE